MNDEQTSPKHSRHLIPGKQVVSEPLTKTDLFRAFDNRMGHMMREFSEGFEVISKYPRSVTIFGSARIGPESNDYKMAHDTAKKLGEAGYAVVTGGGPSIMEAGSCGAAAGGAASIGFNIKLPMEQVLNTCVTESVDYDYFFIRKVLMTYSSEAFIYFPGGFGTLDEFFEIVTLVQTNKIQKVPVICVGSHFWNKLDSFIKETLRDEFATIDAEDCDLYIITDDIDEAVRLATQSNLRDE